MRNRIYEKSAQLKKEGSNSYIPTESKPPAPPQITSAEKMQLKVLSHIISSFENYGDFKAAGGNGELFTGDNRVLYDEAEGLYGKNVFDISKKLIYNEKVTQTAAMAEAYGGEMTLPELNQAVRALTKARLNSYLKTIKGKLDRTGGNAKEEAELLEEYARVKRILLEYTSEV